MTDFEKYINDLEELLKPLLAEVKTRTSEPYVYFSALLNGENHLEINIINKGESLKVEYMGTEFKAIGRYNYKTKEKKFISNNPDKKLETNIEKLFDYITKFDLKKRKKIKGIRI